MSRTSIAAYLEDFGEEPPSFDASSLAVEGANPVLDEASIQLKCEEMFSQGLEEGRRLAAEDFSAERAALEDAVEAAREATAEDLTALGVRLAEALEQAFSDLRSRIAESVADLLKPILLDAVAERAVAALLSALERLTRDRDCPTIEVEGPAALVEAIAARLEAQELSVATRVGADGDVRVRVGRSLIDVRLAEWASALHLEKRASHE